MNAIEPIATKTSAKVPTSSAIPRRTGSCSTRRAYEPSRTASASGVRYGDPMAADAAADNTQTASCPHCHKPFSAELIAGGAERHRGFKCPHCKLFVPESRAEETRSPRRR